MIGIIKSSVISGQNLNFAIPIEQLEGIGLVFHGPIQLAGACAYRDRDKENLKGPVKQVSWRRLLHERIENGRLIEDGILTDEIQQYDIDGNMIENTLFDAVSGKFGVSFVYTYDANGIKASVTLVSGNGARKKTEIDLERGILYKLNDRRFSGSIGSADSPGGLQIFNSEGQMTDWYFGDVRTAYTYGPDGRANESIQSKNGQIEMRSRYRYREDAR
ncbi:MAG: hypothetical protein IPJ55_13920 [Chloracidobacterium sp.]|nr:hypothetical protein [Chloracidobacterium sp.]